MRRVYLDYNATAPTRPEALAAAEAAARTAFGNPSSPHRAGADARDALERARAEVARFAGAAPDRVLFSSSATEANNAVLEDALSRATPGRDRVVVCATEHPSILGPCERLTARGIEVARLPVEPDGRLDPARFAASLDARVLLASVQWANNETGVIQPVAELAALARERGVPFHTDAAQAFGRIPVALDLLGADFASLASHKLGGPKGIGALYCRAPDAFAPLLRGGPQERGLRAGTENVPGAAGFGAACRAAERGLAAEITRLAALRARLEAAIAAKVPASEVHGAAAPRLPQTLCVGFAGADGEALLMALDLAGISVSLGAACASGSLAPSHVLLAMGVPRALARASLRFSLGHATREDEIAHVCDVLPLVVERVRAEPRA
jgi:cysteine desulfurase